MDTELWAIGAVILCTIIGSFGALLLKIGANKVSLNLRRLIKNYALIGGLLLYGFSTIIFIIALKHGELSVLYPFVAMVYVWIIILSKVFLKERLNLAKIVGIVLIIAGVSLIGIGS